MRLKRYVTLNQDEVTTLQEGWKNAQHTQFQARCHCLILSSERHSIDELASIFHVNRLTITNWFDAWKTMGIRGLMNKPGQGRKAILKPSDLPIVKAKVQASPQQIKRVREQLKEELKKEFSTKTLTRFLKSLVRPAGDVGAEA